MPPIWTLRRADGREVSVSLTDAFAGRSTFERRKQEKRQWERKVIRGPSRVPIVAANSSSKLKASSSPAPVGAAFDPLTFTKGGAAPAARPGSPVAGAGLAFAAADDGEKPFTDAEDKIIVGMKAEGKTWAQILEALGSGRTSKSEVQARFKELQKTGKAAGAGKGVDGTRLAAASCAVAEEQKKNKGKKKNGDGGSGAGSDKLTKENLDKVDEKGGDRWTEWASRRYDLTGEWPV